MKRTMFFLVINAAIFLTTTSCQELFNNKDEGPFELILIGDTVVDNNTALRVEVRKTFDDYYYEMFDPSFSMGYAGSSFSTEFASVKNQGWYKFRAHKDGNFAQDSIYVHVIPDSVPCDGPINKVTSLNSGLNFTFGGIFGSIELGNYKVEGHTAQADFYIVFGDITRKPKPGTYTSTYAYSLESEGDATVRVNVGYYIYGNINQKIHVFEENGKTYISLCDFEMSDGSIISAKLEL